MNAFEFVGKVRILIPAESLEEATGSAGNVWSTLRQSIGVHRDALLAVDCDLPLKAKASLDVSDNAVRHLATQLGLFDEPKSKVATQKVGA